MGFLLVFVPIIGMHLVHKYGWEHWEPLVVMNLLLRPLNDINDPVWSVIFSIILLLIEFFMVYSTLKYDD